jgi:hypothetical protein
VQEYVVWQTLDARLEWFEWTAPEYVRRRPDANGIIKSKVSPGLWLNVSALLAEENDQVMDTIEAGVRSGAHRRFVAALSAKRRRKR